MIELQTNPEYLDMLAADQILDGRDATGALLPPGLYLLRLTARTDRGEEHVQRLVSVAY